MKYFIDTEFKEKPNTIQLISIGIVAEDGREYYAISKNFNVKEVWDDEWLRENVLFPIYIENVHGDMRNRIPYTKAGMRRLIYSIGKPSHQIAKEVLYFCSNKYFDQTGFDLKEAVKYELYDNFKPEFYGYYADYDWVVFCWLFGRMIDLPRGFPMYCRDLKQMMDESGLDKKWKQNKCPDPEGEHNALIDAKWNLQLFKAIKNHRSGQREKL